LEMTRRESGRPSPDWDPHYGDPLVEHFASTEDAVIAHLVARTCTVWPQAVSDPGRVVTLAEKAVTADPGHLPYRRTFAAALYGAGKFEEATAQTREAMKRHGGEGTAHDWLLLGLAYRELKQEDTAKKWLARAGQQLDDLKANRLSWEEQLELQLLRWQAEARGHYQGGREQPD